MIAQFAGVLLFWAVYAIAGLKPAIAATVLLVVLELARRAWRGERQQPLFLATSGLSILLGLVDLWLTSPVTLKFEGVGTNLLFAGTMAAGTIRRRPIMQDFAEAARGAPFEQEDAGRTRFLRALGWAWALYFISRATLCLATALTMELPQAMAMRSTYAALTIVPMIAISAGARPLLMVARRRGLFLT